jgi:hypothetical protein
VALCLCFYHWTNTFFSISPNEYASALLDEIYGCFKYIGIPIDTVMNMPIQNRKYFISKHNKDCDEINNKYSNSNSSTLSGDATETFTKMSMNDYGRMR